MCQYDSSMDKPPKVPATRILRKDSEPTTWIPASIMKIEKDASSTLIEHRELTRRLHRVKRKLFLKLVEEDSKVPFEEVDVSRILNDMSPPSGHTSGKVCAVSTWRLPYYFIIIDEAIVWFEEPHDEKIDLTSISTRAQRIFLNSRGQKSSKEQILVYLFPSKPKCSREGHMGSIGPRLLWISSLYHSFIELTFL